MLTALLLAFATGGVACTVPQSELQRQALLSYAAFDLDQGPFGWRHLSSSGCIDSAVTQLQAYAAANIERLTPAQKMELSFHAGQAFALAGREPESLLYFERALAVHVSAEWSAYVQATIAFLKRDTEELRASRDRYAFIAPGSMRLRFIEGMLACPVEPYAKAVHCAK